MDKLMRICKGGLISLLLFGLLTGAGAVILRFTPFPERWNFYWLVAVISIACFFMGLYTAGTFRKAGLISGISVSVVLICVILAAVCAAFSVMPAVGMLRPAYLIPIAAGALGGIFGANIKK